MWQELEAYLVQIVRAELAYQKHHATGRLIDSVRVDTVIEGGLVVLKGYFEDYGAYVDKGRPSGIRRVPIDALMEWARVKGLGGDNIKSFAFAVQNKIFKEGIPTSGGKRIADRRLNFINEALNNELNTIRAMIIKNQKDIYQAQISNLVRKTNKDLI